MFTLDLKTVSFTSLSFTKSLIASHDSSEDHTIISVKKADFIGNAWLHIHNRKGFHFSAN